MTFLCSLLRPRAVPGRGKGWHEMGMRRSARATTVVRFLWRGVSMRKVLPYWSTMADDLDVWHDQGDCPEGAKIPPGRLLQAPTPPTARRHCTVCLFLDKAT